MLVFDAQFIYCVWLTKHNIDVGQVQLGTPPRNFEILMDSGSADLWVGSENCQSLAGGGQFPSQLFNTRIPISCVRLWNSSIPWQQIEFDFC